MMRTTSWVGDIFGCYKDAETIKTNKKIEYLNLSSSFDIETTSAYDADGNKIAFMYEWTFGINGDVVYGRTWDEFLAFYDKLCEVLGLSLERRLCVYVHNLGFEFQFLRKRLTWEKVFAVEERRPVYALTEYGVEFRCSMILSGYSLAELGKHLIKYPVQKMVGDLDYSLIRHANTPLTDKELGYCVNDVRVVMSYIQEKIETDGNITRIPLTKTGYVRRYVRKMCLYDKDVKNNDKYRKYRSLMRSLTVDVDEYSQLKRAFQGGFTHANAFFTDKIVENVSSFDFTSSYPAVMISERFPMSKAEKVTISSWKDFMHNLRTYCCLFDVRIQGLESKTLYEHPLSRSRCRRVVNGVEDNGRLVSADSLLTTMTEQDFYILIKFYRWDSFVVGNFRRYRRGYLPRDFVKAILSLYSDKTTLKDVEGRELDYLKGKEMLNSCYGMCVTDICRDINVYDCDEWNIEVVDVEKAIDDYNNKSNRFLFYPWGVWVTAYARRNLFSGIYECGNDYIYSDTDSVKVRNVDNHLTYFDRYNRLITRKLDNAMKYHDIDITATRPKTVKGVEKPLGVWDFEGTYNRFKTLGAKRYMVEKNGKINITVAGLNKWCCVPYLKEKYQDKIFDKFTEDLYIPNNNDLPVKIYDDNGVEIDNPTGKNIHTYLDYEQRGVIKDYTGKHGFYDELSSVHLSGADYSLKLSDAYADFLMNIQDEVLI